jgi:hypothetical protein
MRASDFIIQTRDELQEKSEHWSNESLLVKLQRAYTKLQHDLPYFVAREALAIEEGRDRYRLKNVPLKNVVLKVEGVKVPYSDHDYFYANTPSLSYTFDGKEALLGFTPTADGEGEIVYKYIKRIETPNCVIELPETYHDALRMLFKSMAYEKPKSNSKERNLSAYYMKLYDREIVHLKLNKPARPKNLGTTYKRI